MHTDMDKTGDSTIMASSATALFRKTPHTSFSTQEPAHSASAKEGSPDAFWLILRELRVISEKLDSLVSGTEPGGFKKNSDKSYH
ncbi:MAG: hypothetical protein WDM78_20650 [Puia sp.]